MHGLHLTADLYACRCDAALLANEDAIARLCSGHVDACGLTRIDERWVKFPDWQGGPGGVTGMVLLAESHLAIHTWPESANVTLDVYVCNFTADNSARARALLDAIVAAYRPARAIHNQLVRGDLDDPGSFEQMPEAPHGWIVERLTPSAAFAYRGEVIERRTTRYQELELLDTDCFGRTLRLDGCFMTSEREEFFYHEALVHPAAIAHGRPARCLIIGGGDGGAAEELLKHPSVEEIIIADLDTEVVEIARRELRAINRGALDDARVHVEIGDGMAYVDRSPGRFDLVLLDLTDPDTPASALYERAAFQRIKQALAPGGALVLHLGSPVFHPDQVRQILARLADVFSMVSPYGLYIPLYGAYWGLAVASDALEPRRANAAEIQSRLDERQVGDLQYYNAEVHGALFALPNYYRALLPG